MTRPLPGTSHTPHTPTCWDALDIGMHLALVVLPLVREPLSQVPRQRA